MNMFNLLGMVYVKLSGLNTLDKRRVFMIFMIFILTIIGYAAAILSLLDFMNVIDLKSMWLDFNIFIILVLGLSPLIYEFWKIIKNYFFNFITKIKIKSIILIFLKINQI